MLRNLSHFLLLYYVATFITGINYCPVDPVHELLVWLGHTATSRNIRSTTDCEIISLPNLCFSFDRTISWSTISIQHLGIVIVYYKCIRIATLLILLHQKTPTRYGAWGVFFEKVRHSILYIETTRIPGLSSYSLRTRYSR